VIATSAGLGYPIAVESDERRVLIVDDDSETRRAVTAFVEALGFKALVARNGAEALAVLGTHERPAVIVLDLGMPVMDGVAFRTALLDDADLATIPVIVLTGRTGRKEWSEGLRAVGVLSKPVRPTDFEALLTRYGAGPARTPR
jgi:CheY-like chemotaxis protein